MKKSPLVRSLQPNTVFTTRSGGTCFDVYAFMPDVIKNEKIYNPNLHMHRFEEFYYIYSGEVMLTFSNDLPDVILTPGDFCLIPSGMYHYATSENVERICFEVNIKSASSDAKYKIGDFRSLREIISSYTQPYVLRSPYVISLMEQYRVLCESDSTHFGVRKILILTEAMFQMMDEISAKMIPKPVKQSSVVFSDDRKWIIEQFISQYFSRGNCLTMLANELGLTERRTSTIVREIMGKSLKELIVEERMTVAKFLMKSRKYSLEEISEIVGYKSYSGFYIAWKKYYGFVPEDTP